MNAAQIIPSINHAANVGIVPDYMTSVIPQPRPVLTLVTTTPAAVPQRALTMSLVRKMVLKSYIASGSKSEHKSFPYVAANTSFENIGYADETAASLNKALRSGGRGLSQDTAYLDWVDSLPSDVPPTLRSYIQSELTPRASFVKFVRETLSKLDAMQ